MQKKTISLIHRNGSKYAGVGAKTLVSALTGATSKSDTSGQLRKVEAFMHLEKSVQPDIISDLSLQKSGTNLYSYIIKNFPEFIVSTLPVYQCNSNSGIIEDKELLSITQQQIEAGVGFITIHPTPNRRLMTLAQRRLVPWTSRGGAIVMKDLTKRGLSQDNVYLRVLDDIIKVAFQGKTAISIGASFRSANIFDSMDQCQIEECTTQKKIADYIAERGVDVIIEGPGHSSPRKLIHAVKIYQEMGYPIMPLGPIPTDTAIGQDHISSAIGAVIMGMHNCVDIIAAVTREEHTGGIPTIESSLEAIRSAKIAAHIIDMNKLGDYTDDHKIALARAKNQTCVYGKKNSGCRRCADACPLTFETD